MKPVYSQKFLERLAAAKQQGSEQQNGADDSVRQVCDTAHIGPPDPGPPKRRNGKGSWRDDARALEELCPEEFGKSAQRSNRTSQDTDQASEPPTVEPQCPRDASVASQSASEALPARSPMPSVPPLQSSFWQALLYGSPDSLVGSSDATSALQLLAQGLGVAIETNETIPTLRGGELRKLLRERFGHAQAEQTMAALWRRGLLSTPGTPVPNDDQTNCSPGVRDCPRSMPAWREFHQEVNQEQRILEGIGGWPGG